MMGWWHLIMIVAWSDSFTTSLWYLNSWTPSNPFHFFHKSFSSTFHSYISNCSFVFLRLSFHSFHGLKILASSSSKASKAQIQDKPTKFKGSTRFILRYSSIANHCISVFKLGSWPVQSKAFFLCLIIKNACMSRPKNWTVLSPFSNNKTKNPRSQVHGIVSCVYCYFYYIFW